MENPGNCEGESENGLCTEEALNKLYVEIETVVQQFKASQRNRKTKSWIRDTLHHNSQHTTLNWIAIAFFLWAIFSLLVAFLLGESEIWPFLVVFLLFFVGFCMKLHDNKVRYDEVPDRIRGVLQKIREAKAVSWSQESYPGLNIPISPCITLQWTLRDGKIVNLPWALLVKDDVILMKPGQLSPGFCEALDKANEFQLLHAKEVYSPSLQNNEMFSAPKARRPLQAKKYKLLETPYLNNLRIFLEQAVERPISQHNQQRHLVMVKTVERFVLPAIFLLVITGNLVRLFYLKDFVGLSNCIGLFLVNPTNVVLPLLPLIFPLLWNCLNYFGMAKFKMLFDASKSFISQENPFGDEADLTSNGNVLKSDFKKIMKNFWSIFVGRSGVLCRSTNILHVLGSVTALGCVDKKGILSWPNPTAEKVFFLHNNENESPTSSLGNVGDLNQDPQEPFSQDSPGSATAEVLDLSHNHNDPFRLHFDDNQWHKHLTSLKPLGLAILLNTCNVETQEQYQSFCSHITCEAIYNEHLVPVINRRCLCELAKEIGFVEEAQKIFGLEQQLSTFRHLQPEMVRRDNKYARSLNLSTKLKFPFPHMFAVVVKELTSGSMQLLSEGTADILLDSCIDYWDGHDLCPLGLQDRKKILDFYQRSSLTAYCTAFAYRPLTTLTSSKMSQVYLELPSDSRHLYLTQRSPCQNWDHHHKIKPNFFSTDSLLYNEPSSEAESCFQMQCNQIFIGMVTMQYQPLIDMVQLIEQLERACIRFVHFSKENELRSRVFSEKMGLESGWNCHISLSSERNSNLESSRTMSFSAPCAINLEHSIVKFDDEIEKIEEKSVQEEELEEMNEQQKPDWQSLSCLTDSTEHSAPINFDMSNRAKLPRGIDKIRPHIELIDNVPLLVSLFTDCTPSATKEMLKIMQEYREVVCIMGSCENCENAGVFMQADASIAVEPLYPQICQKQSVFKASGSLSPLDLSCELNSVACSLALRRQDPISLYYLVMEARHFVTVLWSSVQFYLGCTFVVALVQLAAALFMLPAILTTGQVLWFCCIVIPFLMVSLMVQPLDFDSMKKPQGKFTNNITLNMLVFLSWCYGLKFLPTVAVVLISFMGLLAGHCAEICRDNCSCALFFSPISTRSDFGDSLEGWTDDAVNVCLARLVVVFLLLLHFVVISMGFVHRDFVVLQKSPFKNFYWLTTIFFLVTLQGAYTIYEYYRLIGKTPEELQQPYFTLWVIIFAAFSPVLIVFVNELVKRQEIMVNQRFLKRVRLDFGTKLGMNSPF